MRILEDAFVLIHIRISSARFLGFSARHFVSVFMIFLVAFSAFQIYKSSVVSMNLLDFIESSFYTIILIYFVLFWLKSWPKANKLLKQAGDYEEKKDHQSK